jgi:hypothetical protein
MPTILALAQACVDDIAVKLQPHTVAELDRPASESRGRVDRANGQRRANALNIDAVLALKEAENGVIGDVCHHFSLDARIHAQLTPSAIAMRTNEAASMVSI